MIRSGHQAGEAIAGTGVQSERQHRLICVGVIKRPHGFRAFELDNNEAARVSDEAVAQILTAAIRLYVAKSDGEERTFPPIAGERDSEMTPTELLSAVSEMLRALHLGPMELALWYRRRPDEDSYSAGEKS